MVFVSIFLIWKQIKYEQTSWLKMNISINFSKSVPELYSGMISLQI